MSVVIRAENLFKKYMLGSIGHNLLYRDLQSWWANVRGKEDPNTKITFSGHSAENRQDNFFALHDVSFDVNQGDIVGIIGRNGAGKSTLLKILSRVTAPTMGVVKMRGRIASLLEVGTGFHPDLTGRENIYLNGAILGMSRSEIKKKLDEIVSFADMDRFLDTPVKRYSSGMYVRLAFAVAAHLEPEILVVDEVLAVGDAGFQEKCLGKMKNVANSGRTVLFVSHNIRAIQSLCTRGIVLEKGKVVYDGLSSGAINHYVKSLHRDRFVTRELTTNARREGSGRVRFIDVQITDSEGIPQNMFCMGDTLRIRLNYEVFNTMRGIKIFIAFRSGPGREAITSVEHIMTRDIIPPGAIGSATIDIPDIQLRAGEYPSYFHISEAIATHPNFDELDDVLPPIIIEYRDNYNYHNYNPAEATGFFSIPSQVIDHQLKCCAQ
ncbi:ABC transporter ATP-binding protein [Anaeroselena agilis]|uniref:ABC transporter ATP-binding protein n=1 Tax=Anaeroselena agilis TaxID=3063788 RepID=A0ABU3P5B6_9FIRM|nr:ABC transporter ATP-binding protein [Selenomonadales bacterium 4137-cl]